MFFPSVGRSNLNFRVRRELLVLWSVKIGLRNAGGTWSLLRGCQWQSVLGKRAPHSHTNGRERPRQGKDTEKQSWGSRWEQEMLKHRAAGPHGQPWPRMGSRGDELEHSTTSTGSSVLHYSNVLRNTVFALPGSLGEKGAASLYYEALHAGSAPC